MIKRLTLPDGSRVGIPGLDEILNDVIALNLTENEAIKAELLRRVKDGNYVAPAAEADYATALLREYEARLGRPVLKMEKHRHTAG